MTTIDGNQAEKSYPFPRKFLKKSPHMKVLMINGSPRPNGNTSIALREMENIFTAEGIETEIIQIGNKPIRGCIACGSCAEKGKCVFDDAVNEIAPKFEACDGLVVAAIEHSLVPGVGCGGGLTVVRNQ